MTDEQNRPKPPAEGVVPTDITEIINRAVDTGIRNALTDLITDDVWETARAHMDGERELRNGIRSVVRTRLREKLGLIRV